MGLSNASELARLRSVKVLGKGMSGEVHECVDPSTGARYVVKRLRENLKGVVDGLRFVREAQFMGKLRHPNVMPIVFASLQSDPPQIVMPYYEGRTVQARLQEGRVGAPLATTIAREVCRALAEVHRHGIVHRDVKPANVFLELGGRTLLFDFGLAKQVVQVTGQTELAITAQGAILGTPAYMSPEQCRGEDATDKSDVYALGVMLVEMLLGKNPFSAGADVIETIRRQLALVPRRLDALLPSKVNEELGELVHRMLAKNPAHRPTAESCLETFAGLARRSDVETRITARPVLVARAS